MGAHFLNRFIWSRNNTLLGTSEVTLIWDIPHNTEPGTYRIRYFGENKSLLQKIGHFSGTTKAFAVRSLFEFENELNALKKLSTTGLLTRQ